MFTIISKDDWSGDTQKTYDESLEKCKEMAENNPDTDFWVAELKAKVFAELKVTVNTEEEKITPNN